MSSRADARRLLEIADQLGFTYLGKDGQGHHSLVHENGTRYAIAATPSDYRGVKNTIADLERISGQKIDRPNARRSRKGDQSSGFSMAKAKREAEQRAQAAREAARIKAAADRAARERAEAAAAAERRRREIEDLMKPGWGR